MADDSVARLRLGALLHLDWHHGVVAQIDDGDVPVLNEVRVLHKTHADDVTLQQPGKKSTSLLQNTAATISRLIANYSDN